jgi:hypothetical protein
MCAICYSFLSSIKTAKLKLKGPLQSNLWNVKVFIDFEANWGMVWFEFYSNFRLRFWNQNYNPNFGLSKWFQPVRQSTSTCLDRFQSKIWKYSTWDNWVCYRTLLVNLPSVNHFLVC